MAKTQPCRVKAEPMKLYSVPVFISDDRMPDRGTVYSKLIRSPGHGFEL